MTELAPHGGCWWEGCKICNTEHNPYPSSWKSKVRIDELPRVVPKYILQQLDPNGRDCEVCGNHMYDHEWAIMDTQGFVIGCDMKDKA